MDVNKLIRMFEDKSRSPEILREAGPATAPVATCSPPQAEPGCQARRAPVVDSLENLVDYRHDQVPGQVRQVLSSTVMIGQGEEEIVKEDISVTHVRAEEGKQKERKEKLAIYLEKKKKEKSAKEKNAKPPFRVGVFNLVSLIIEGEFSNSVSLDCFIYMPGPCATAFYC